MIREVLTMERLSAMDPDEAAALWTVRLAEGEHAHEADLFEEWVSLAPANRAAWDRAQRSWSLFDQAGDDEIIEELRRNARAARPTAHRSWTRFAAAAAALLAVASGSVLIERGIVSLPGTRPEAPSGSGPPVLAASFTYENGRAMPKLVTLPDGTRLTLDAQSRVTAQFGGGKRNVELVSGRAFFEVRHDSARPFAVRAANLRLVDLGTRFDVELAPRGVRVTLVEGRLSVTGPGLKSPLLIAPGERLTADGDRTPVVAAAQGERQLSWQNGFATFDNVSLSEAAAALNRYPGETLVVRDPRVAGLRISGNFRLGDPKRFGRALEQIYPVRLRERGPDQVEIVPAG